MILYAPLLAAVMLAHCHADGLLPDRSCTPGAVETADVSTICGQSTRERRNVPEAVRRERFAAYGISWNDRSRYELDHLVPLEVGGSNDASNLWPELLDDAHRKDRVEDDTHRRVCRGELTPADAQHFFETDWTSGIR